MTPVKFELETLYQKNSTKLVTNHTLCSKITSPQAITLSKLDLLKIKIFGFESAKLKSSIHCTYLKELILSLQYCFKPLNQQKSKSITVRISIEFSWMISFIVFKIQKSSLSQYQYRQIKSLKSSRLINKTDLMFYNLP